MTLTITKVSCDVWDWYLEAKYVRQTIFIESYYGYASEKAAHMGALRYCKRHNFTIKQVENTS